MPFNNVEKVIISLLFILVGLVFSGCPANLERKAAREIYQNKMNFNFKDSRKIDYKGLVFRLPKKFETNYYSNHLCSIGSNCKTYSIGQLQLFFGITQLKQNEVENILYVSQSSNPLKAILQHAAVKRKQSMNNQGRISELLTISSQVNCIMNTVVEPFAKYYSEEADFSTIYYISAIEKNKRYYVIQFCGKADKMRYFLDDFKRILRTLK